MTDVNPSAAITEQVRERYAAAATRVQSGGSCCDSSCCSSNGSVVTSDPYATDQVDMLPEAGLDPATLPDDMESADGKLASAFVRATKPLTATTPVQTRKSIAVINATTAACCDSTCCK